MKKRFNQLDLVVAIDPYVYFLADLINRSNVAFTLSDIGMILSKKMNKAFVLTNKGAVGWIYISELLLVSNQ